jgi:hypothetical protein
MLLAVLEQLYALKAEFDTLKARLDSTENIDEKQKIGERIEQITREFEGLLRAEEKALGNGAGDGVHK